MVSVVSFCLTVCYVPFYFMKKENAIGCLRTLQSDIKLDVCNVTIHYSVLVILGNYNKESGGNIFLSASFPPVIAV